MTSNDFDLIAQRLQQAWPTEPAHDLPAVRRHQQWLPAELAPQRRYETSMFTPPQQTVVVQAGPDPWVWRPLAFGAASAMGGTGVWLAGLGIRAVGSVSLWAVAAMFISTALIRVLAPKREAGNRSTTIVIGHHNNVR